MEVNRQLFRFLRLPVNITLLLFRNVNEPHTTCSSSNRHIRTILEREAQPYDRGDTKGHRICMVSLMVHSFKTIAALNRGRGEILYMNIKCFGSILNEPISQNICGSCPVPFLIKLCLYIICPVWRPAQKQRKQQLIIPFRYCRDRSASIPRCQARGRSRILTVHT